jgi:hypothetical protein
MHPDHNTLELCKSINGSAMTDGGRFGHLTMEKAAETIADTLVICKAATDAVRDGAAIPTDLTKTITLSNGIYGVDLSGPARNLFPTITPLANMLGRNVRKNAANGLQFKQILAITGSGYNFFGFVPEGQRAGRMNYTTVAQNIGYATIGEEDRVTEEAQSASEGFEDILSTAALRVLLKARMKEEAALLCGNKSMPLGTTPTPVATASGSGATLPAATYSVICVALTQMGYLNSSLTAGVATSQTVTGADGQTFAISGGSANKSVAASQAATLGQTLFASVAPVNGAVAYAWFVGVSGSEKLEAITTIASVAFTAPLNGTHQAATAITADNSSDPKAFDGYMTTTAVNGLAGNALVVTLANGVAGTGTQLTSNGAGGVTEVDALLKNAWDQYRISFGVIYVSSQELKSITKLTMQSTTNSALRYNVSADSGGNVGFDIVAGGIVAWYANPYSVDGVSKVPIKIHPNLAPGTILFTAATLPPWYISSETPVVAEIIVRKDWNVRDWVQVTRSQDMGVYAQEALAIYAPFASAIICNIAPTP